MAGNRSRDMKRRLIRQVRDAQQARNDALDAYVEAYADARLLAAQAEAARRRAEEARERAREAGNPASELRMFDRMLAEQDWDGPEQPDPADGHDAPAERAVADAPESDSRSGAESGEEAPSVAYEPPVAYGMAGERDGEAR